MAEVSHWLSFVVGILCLPAFALAGIVLHLRLRRRATLALAMGLVLAAVGQLIQLLSPMRQFDSMDEVRDTLLVQGSFPAVWFLGSTISSIGFAVACAGFIGLALTARKTGRDI